MPWLSACKPFALEMITGRLPAGATTGNIFSGWIEIVPAGADFAKSDVAPAAALPASEVRKNFRRVQSPMMRSFSQLRSIRDQKRSLNDDLQEMLFP
jgi:hypothetical protein